MSTEEEAKVEVPTEEGAEGGQEEETVKEEESNAHFEPLVSRSLLCVRASKVWCVPFLLSSHSIIIMIIIISLSIAIIIPM